MDTTRPLIGIIDDDISFREALAGLVQSLGYNVVTFASARELLNFESLPGIGCLISDVEMPEMSGLELQQHLLKSGRRLPVIFATAHRQTNVRARASLDGAVAFLEKPFDTDELVRHIGTALAP